MSHKFWMASAIYGLAAVAGVAACATPGMPAAGHGPTPTSGKVAAATTGHLPSRAESGAGHAVALSTGTTTTTVPTISASDLSMMADDGDTVRPVSAQDSATRNLVHVTAPTALETALHTHSFLSGSRVESVSLARLTDSNYGPEATATDSASGTAVGGVIPIIKDRLVWLVIFSHFAMPIFGPAPDGTSAQVPDDTTPNGRMWIAVDAATGRALLGSSIQNGD